MIHELERIWVEAIVAHSRFYPSIWLEYPRILWEALAKRIDVPTEIRSDTLHNTCLEHCLYASLFDSCYFIMSYSLRPDGSHSGQFICRFLLWTNIESLFLLKITSVHFPNKTMGLFPYNNRIMMCVNLAQRRAMYVCGLVNGLHDMGYRLKEFDVDMS
jgi:hypothetical protein